MELSDYIRIIRQRGWMIIVLAVLTAAAAYGYSRMQPEVYESNVNVLITSRPDYGQAQATRFLVLDFAAYLNSTYRALAVIDALQLDMTPDALLGSVTIAAASDSNIIRIEVRNTNPDLANDIARKWAEQLIIYRNQENAGLQKADRIEAQLLDDPQYSLYRPQTRVNTAAGGVFGALLGVILIFVLEWVESGILRRSEDVERFLDAPVIGKIPTS